MIEVVSLEDWEKKNEKVRSLWWDNNVLNFLSLMLISMS